MPYAAPLGQPQQLEESLYCTIISGTSERSMDVNKFGSPCRRCLPVLCSKIGLWECSYLLPTHMQPCRKLGYTHNVRCEGLKDPLSNVLCWLLESR
jgi:hypothetical protein